MSFITAVNINRVYDELLRYLPDNWEYYDMLQSDMTEWYRRYPKVADIGKLGHLSAMNQSFISYYLTVVYPSRTPGPEISSFPNEVEPTHGPQDIFPTNLAKDVENPVHHMSRPNPGYLSAMEQLQELKLGDISVAQYCSREDSKFFKTALTRGRGSKNTGVERRISRVKPSANGCSCVEGENCRGKCGCDCFECDEFLIENKQPRARYDASKRNLKDGSTYSELNDYQDDGFYINSQGQRFVPQVDRDGYVGMRNVNHNALGWEYGMEIDRNYPTVRRHGQKCWMQAPDNYKYPSLGQRRTMTCEVPNAPQPFHNPSSYAHASREWGSSIPRTNSQIQQKLMGDSISHPKYYPGYAIPKVLQREKTNLFEHGKYQQQLLGRLMNTK